MLDAITVGAVAVNIPPRNRIAIHLDSEPAEPVKRCSGLFHLPCGPVEFITEWWPDGEAQAENGIPEIDSDGELTGYVLIQYANHSEGTSYPS